MMDNKTRRNMMIYAENTEGKSGFDIYISFSGQREYLMFHRHNAFLYELLKDGVKVDEFKRLSQQMIGDMASARPKFQLHDTTPTMKRRRNLSRRFENSTDHIISTIEEYLIYERETA